MTKPETAAMGRLRRLRGALGRDLPLDRVRRTVDDGEHAPCGPARGPHGRRLLRERQAPPLEKRDFAWILPRT
ncbi:MAG: hypothetical protein MZU97_11340 [Bacillus subtilis]|nr:hypothetical protein [Bacillus subtilis]